MENSNKVEPTWSRMWRPKLPAIAIKVMATFARWKAIWQKKDSYKIYGPAQPFMILQLKYGNELWWVRLANGNKHYSVFGVEIEEDGNDPELRVYQLIALGLVLSVGFP